MLSLIDVDEVVVTDPPQGPPDAISQHVASHVLEGTSVLGASVLVERATGFLANVISARLAGASVFGSYALGISTANNISVYAAGGIGATATRFSGKYPFESGEYATLARVLATISILSAAIAAVLLLAASPWIATLLHRPDLEGLLQWAAISAVGTILLECARGFFVGQRRLKALAVLSVFVGIGMLVLLPLMSLTGHPERMVASQGCIAIGAVILCLILAVPLSLLTPLHRTSRVPFFTMLRELWGYGLVQLGGLLSANLAGWWVTVLVARGDPTLAQMGFFAVAGQFRNIAGLLPSLLTEGSFASMAAANEDGSTHVQHRLMAICTYAATAVSMLFASVAIVAAPWLLRFMYGKAYGAAALAVAVGMSIAVLQMGNAPTSARISILSIRVTAVINTLWAVFTAALGTLWILHGGSAWQAMSIFLLGHILMASSVLVVLRKIDYVPRGLFPLLYISTTTMLILCVLAYLRTSHPEHIVSITFLMMGFVFVSSLLLLQLGKTHHLLPPDDTLKRSVRALRSKLASNRVVQHFRRFSFLS